MPTMPISILSNISHFFFLQKFYLYHLARVNVRLSHRVLEPGAGQGAAFKENSCSISIISTIYNLVSACVLGSQIMGACTHKTQPPRTHAARTLGDNRFPSPRTARVFLYTTGGSNKTLKKMKNRKDWHESKVHDEDRLLL